jgi:hypothetical protein
MRCRGVQGIANAAYLEGFPFPALLCVAPYCVPGGIRVVSIEHSCLIIVLGCGIHLKDVQHLARQARIQPNPRPLLSLDALSGPQHRRRDRRSVGLGDLLWPFSNP